VQKAIGYIRVSTQGQADEGVSLAAQRAKIEAWCSLNDAELVAVFEDAGISGGSMNGRDGLHAALEATTKGMALVTYSISRLARNTRDMLDIAERLEKKGADLVSLSERIDTTTASGRMVFRMLAVLAEFEREQIGERTVSRLLQMCDVERPLFGEDWRERRGPSRSPGAAGRAAAPPPRSIIKRQCRES